MITFKKEHLSFTQDLDTTVEYIVHNDVSLHEIFLEFRKFLMAAGYSPESINEYVEAE